MEINTREHFSLLGMRGVQFVVDNPRFNSECIVQTFEPDELLATKPSALYPRRKSRDLFDLWSCLDRGLFNPKRVVDVFSNTWSAKAIELLAPSSRKICTPKRMMPRS